MIQSFALCTEVGRRSNALVSVKLTIMVQYLWIVQHAKNYFICSKISFKTIISDYCFQGLSAAPNQATLTPPTIRTPYHVTPPTIRTPHFLTPSTSPYHVTNSVPSSISCFTCEDYLTFRCKSFATECVNTCMIRYRDGKLESKCTMVSLTTTIKILYWKCAFKDKIQ